jgi:hypothetical protein
MFLMAPALLAQKYEINPYGGGYWPGRTSVGKLKKEGIYGLRGGIFLDTNFELEGNFGYLNHFEVRGIDPKSRGLLWEAAGNYNFSAKDWPVIREFTPFVVVGLGGITTHLETVDSYSFIPGTPAQLINTNTSVPGAINVNDNDTFFTVSYGGGFKSVKLWGPLGLRADVRGRTLPNYYHSAPTWLEATFGINFMWGEK